MSACCRHVLGLLLSIIGFLGTIFICALQMWKISGFIGSSITISEIHWEGLWLKCVMRSTGEMQCKSYNSIQDLPQDLQDARVLIVFAIIIQFFGIVLGVVGAKCTNFIPDSRRKTKAAIASGVLLLTAASLVALPVQWTTHAIVNDMFNPDLANNQRTVLGASLFIGWVSAGLLYLGGALLCCSFFCRNETECDVKSAHTNTKQQRSSRQRSPRNKEKVS
ncbi:claudin-4-like [Oreochromis niloticus]|uniref:claudin-4-like n=1 Tax=Oreochromis niloticus TaxID=8128 RepID=UPI00025FCD70|nr:claudin-4-like [Oreochromis niloticus]